MENKLESDAGSLLYKAWNGRRRDPDYSENNREPFKVLWQRDRSHQIHVEDDLIGCWQQGNQFEEEGNSPRG